jgi:4'-phosphopantetheinyl transferase
MVPILIGDCGKPRLEEDSKGVRFNLSHSDGMALIAIAEGHEVGVDLEQIRWRRDLVGLAERVLPKADVEKIRRAPPLLRSAAFYAGWTRHEARMKCFGTGLSSTPQGQQPKSVNVDVAPGFAAAVAVQEGHLDNLRLWTLRPG